MRSLNPPTCECTDRPNHTVSKKCRRQMDRLTTEHWLLSDHCFRALLSFPQLATFSTFDLDYQRFIIWHSDRDIIQPSFPVRIG